MPANRAAQLAILDEVLVEVWGQDYVDHAVAVRAIHAQRTAEVAQLLDMPIGHVNPFMVATAAWLFDRPDLTEPTPRFVPPADVS